MRATMNGLVALAFGGLGGFVFLLIGAPLPWTRGSLFAAAAVAIAGGRWKMPAPVRDVARPVVGLMAGGAFTPAVVATLGEWWPTVVFVIAYTLAITALGWLFFRRLCGLDPVTSFFASSPGGLGEMVLQGGALGGHVRTMTLIHSVRIVIVVFTVPFVIQMIAGGRIGTGAGPIAAHGPAALIDWLILAACGVAGYLVAKLVKLPGGPMVVSMLFSALVHGTGVTEVVPPSWLLALVQVVIGSVAGARFAGVSWREARRTLLQAAAWCVVLLATAALCAALAAQIFGRPFGALLLALSPGGLPEMTIISYALGLEVAFVVTCQVVRSFSSSALAPVLFAACGSPGAKRENDE
jgi:membrane AbrB-like protein